MTQTFGSTQSNDFYLDRRGNITVLSGVQAVGDLCRTAVQAQRGEMQYAADQGMPTFATAWNRYNPVQFEAAARAILRRIPDVLGVVSFAVERRGDVLGYTAVIQTVYGETTING